MRMKDDDDDGLLGIECTGTCIQVLDHTPIENGIPARSSTNTPSPQTIQSCRVTTTKVSSFKDKGPSTSYRLLLCMYEAFFLPHDAGSHWIGVDETPDLDHPCSVVPMHSFPGD